MAHLCSSIGIILAPSTCGKRWGRLHRLSLPSLSSLLHNICQDLWLCNHLLQLQDLGRCSWSAWGDTMLCFLYDHLNDARMHNFCQVGGCDPSSGTRFTYDFFMKFKDFSFRAIYMSMLSLRYRYMNTFFIVNWKSTMTCIETEYCLWGKWVRLGPQNDQHDYSIGIFSLFLLYYSFFYMCF